MSEQLAAIKQKDISSSHWEQLHVLATNTEGNLVACGGVRPDGQPTQITIFDPENGVQKHAISDLDGALTSLLFCSETQLICGFSDGTYSLWNLSKKKPHNEGTGKLSDTPIRAFALSSDRATVYVGSQDGQLNAVSLKSMTPQALSFAWPQGIAINTLVADQHGTWVAAAGDDAVIRVFHSEDGTLKRSMEGHEGPIHDMLLNSSDNRLISTGEDCSIRLWYLQGEVEFENRAESGSHESGIRKLALGPVQQDESGETIPPRLFTASNDGTVKVWPLGNKRKPKTLPFSRTRVTGVVSIPRKDGALLLASGENRCLRGWKFDVKTELEGCYLTINSAYHKLKETTTKTEQKQRAKALKELSGHLADSDVYETVIHILQNDATPEIRAQAAEILSTSPIRHPIHELREALNDKHTKVRKAALLALRTLQGESHLSPLSCALESHHADLRRFAVKELVPLTSSSPQATKLLHLSLQDSSFEVQVEALNGLEVIYPSSPSAPNPKAILIALQNGTEELKKESIHRIYRYKWTQLEEVRPILARFLNQYSESLRHLAFEVLIAGIPALAQALRPRNAQLDRALQDLDERQKKKKENKTDKIESKTKKLPSSPPPQLEDALLQPLLLAQVCNQDDLALRASVLLASLRDLRAFGSLLKFSRSSNAVDRKETAASLEQLGDLRVIPCLERLLNDNNGEVSNTAFESLQTLVSKPLDVAAMGLQSVNPDIRNRALQQLALNKKDEKPNEQALELLKQTLSDREENVRNEAFKILWNQFIKTEPSKCLLPALHAHPNEMCKKAIDEIVAGFGKEEWAIDGLNQVLLEPNETTRKHAYQALIKLAPKGDASPHELALRSQYPEMRRQALQKLTSFKMDIVRPLLLLAVKDKEQDIRRLALEQLLKRFSKDANVLAETLDTTHWDVRLRIAEHLAGMGDKRALEVVADYLEDEHTRLMTMVPPIPPKTEPSIEQIEQLPSQEKDKIHHSRIKIIEIVKILGEPEGIQYIESYLSDSNDTVSETTAYTISRCADETNIELLRALLGHKKRSYQVLAAEGLVRLGRDDGWSLIESLSDHSLETTRRSLAAFYTLPKRGTGLLLQALDNSSETLRRDAFALILAKEVAHARQGKEPVYLTSLLASQYEDIQLQAAECLALRADRSVFEAHIYKIVSDVWPVGSTKKEQDNKERASKQLEVWFAGLNSQDPTLRFTAASLLGHRDEPSKFTNELKRVFRRFAKPKLPTNSKIDQKITAMEYASLAFGTYANLSRGGNELKNKKQAIKNIASLATQGLLSLELVLPALLHGLEDSDHSELRKFSFQHLQSIYPEQSRIPFEVGLRSPHSDVGLHALSLLAQETTEQAKELTAFALNSFVRDIRYKAAEQLGLYYDEDSLEPLIQALGSEHADVRLRVVDRLLTSDDSRVTDALKKALNSDHDDLRLKAAEALAQRKDLDSFPVLEEFLKREESHYQKRSVEALLELRTENTSKIIIERIENDPEGTVERGTLIGALGRLQSTDAVPWLIQSLEQSDYYFRLNAFDALVLIPGSGKKRDQKQLVGYMAQALQSKQSNNRSQAIDQLSEIKDDDIQNILASCFHDRDESVRRSAVKTAIARIPKLDSDVEVLMPLLQHSDDEIRLNAACTLADYQRKEAFLPLFTTFQTSMNEYDQVRAVDALGRLGDQRALEPLLALWAEDAEQHPAQEAAAEALGRLASDERRAEIKTLLQTLLQHSTNSIRIRAIRGIRYIDSKNAVQSITQVIRQASGWSGWSIRQECAIQLGELGDLRAEGILIKLLSDDDSDVREEAIDALFKLFGKENIKIHALVLDSEEFRYEYRLRENAAAYLAKHASPIELIERLPSLVPANNEQPDLFIDAVNDSSDEESSESVDSALARTLQNGLLSRKPLPLEGFYEGLSHKHIQVRTNVVYLLAQMDQKEAGPELNKACKNTAKEWLAQPKQKQKLAKFWHTALWSLSNLDQAEAADASRNILKENIAPPNVQALAAQLLGQFKISTKATVEVLRQALQHSQEKVRRQASWALAELGDLESSSLAALPEFPSASHYLVESKMDHAQLSAQALLSHIGKRELLPTLITEQRSEVFVALSQPEQEESAQYLAIQALGTIANEVAIGALDSLRQNEAHSKDVRRAAYRAWRRAKRHSSMTIRAEN